MGKWDEKTTDMVSPTALNGFLCPTSEADLGYFGGSAGCRDLEFVLTARSPEAIQP